MVRLHRLVLVGLIGHALAQLNNLTTPTLNLTAIGAANGESTLECWQLDAKFRQDTTPGVSGALSLSLGATANATYTVLPARFDGGFHRAPARQFVLFMSGLVHISLPNSTHEAWVEGGKYGLIIAADTADVSAHGHWTRYPSASDTTSIQLPLNDGDDFSYQLLHDGPCSLSEMTGI